MTTDRIWLSPPHLNGHEDSFVKLALETNWVSPYGQNLDKFEAMLEEYFGLPDCALTITGTAAIHLALVLAGVKRGDEVMVPSLNFAGCINPILYQGATPVFVDSEPENWNLDPQLLEEAIIDRIKLGKTPKAILAVHLFGIPCKIIEIMAIGQKYGIPVIEDAADALGTRIGNRLAGTFGVMGVISFNGNKILTTSQGGCLLSQDPKLIQEAKYLSNQARKLKPYYIYEEVGFNYMLSNVLAGIGCGQMPTVEERVEKKIYIYEYYRKHLSHLDSLCFHTDLPNHKSNRWLSTVMVKPNEEKATSRNSLYNTLLGQNIESRPVWRPMHLQPAYKEYEFYGNDVALQLFNNGLCLPSGTAMTDKELQQIVFQIEHHLG